MHATVNGRGCSRETLATSVRRRAPPTTLSPPRPDGSTHARSDDQQSGHIYTSDGTREAARLVALNRPRTLVVNPLRFRLVRPRTSDHMRHPWMQALGERVLGCWVRLKGPQAGLTFPPQILGSLTGDERGRTLASNAWHNGICDIVVEASPQQRRDPMRMRAQQAGCARDHGQAYAGSHATTGASR